MFRLLLECLKDLSMLTWWRPSALSPTTPPAAPAPSLRAPFSSCTQTSRASPQPLSFHSSPNVDSHAISTARHVPRLTINILLKTPSFSPRMPCILGASLLSHPQPCARSHTDGPVILHVSVNGSSMDHDVAHHLSTSQSQGGHRGPPGPTCSRPCPPRS